MVIETIGEDASMEMGMVSEIVGPDEFDLLDKLQGLCELLNFTVLWFLSICMALY